MSTLEIKKPSKEKKAKTISMRLTQKEIDELNNLKEKLGFDSITDLMGYSVDIFKKLYEWNNLNYNFYIGDNQKSDYKQIIIEF